MMRPALLFVGLFALLFPLPALAEEQAAPEPEAISQPLSCNSAMVQGLQHISRGLLLSEVQLLLQFVEQNNSSHYELWEPYTALQMRHSCLRNALCHSVQQAVLAGASPDGAALPITLNPFGGVTPGPFAYCITRNDLEVDEYTPPTFTQLWSAEALHTSSYIPEGFFDACTAIGTEPTSQQMRQSLSNICGLHAEREAGIFTETLLSLLSRQSNHQVTAAFVAQSAIIATNLGQAQTFFTSAMDQINDTFGTICQIPN